MKKLTTLFIAFILVAGIATQSFAANDNNENESSEAMTTSLKGKVVDQNTGEALTGVKVEIQGAEKETYTDFEGNFKITSLKPGSYKIVASYISYKEEVHENLQLELSDKNQITLKLKSLEE
jgi:protocatechuate 3,4-dioxygenase beta subunit